MSEGPAAPEPPASTARLCSFSVVVTVPNLALLRMRNWVVSEIENSLRNMSLQVVGCQKRPVEQTSSGWRIVAVLQPTWAARSALVTWQLGYFCSNALSITL